MEGFKKEVISRLGLEGQMGMEDGEGFEEKEAEVPDTSVNPWHLADAHNESAE